jgi:hypothetical protein
VDGQRLTQTGYQVLVLNPRQTASWAASLGLPAKTDGLDAQAQRTTGASPAFASATSAPRRSG